ncbi:helix-turn-helix transcriptional regulator [Variovorax sp. LT1R16]|uniref:helix-turn-helix transcriptional regulator n=1 Tax=Variovorax sp. LT1R16 TaxID=3443728 RepID=UPI003F48A03F
MSSPAPPQRFSAADFDRLGDDAGFRYRLPFLSGAPRDPAALCIAEGRVEAHTLGPGLTLVASDVVAHHHYEAISVARPQFSAIVMLQGQAQAALGSGDRVPMLAQGGTSAAYGDAVSMTGIHPARQRLRSINVSASASGVLFTDEPQLAELITAAIRAPSRRFGHWPVPPHLVQAIEQVVAGQWDGPLQTLLCKGVGLQLLAHALAPAASVAPGSGRSPLSARDRRLLERVRERLHETPEAPHTLEALARLACMSPSTLRIKFRAAYQCSVFEWLHERRMALAHAQLAQGLSVQAAARLVGYRHATNFATAYRKRFGLSPSERGRA